MSHWKRLGIKQGTPVWLLGDTFNILIKRESFYECILRLYKQHPKERYVLSSTLPVFYTNSCTVMAFINDFFFGYLQCFL